MRAPPWITDCPHQLLTEIPSCEAEHMAAPTNAANVKKLLANSEPFSNRASVVNVLLRLRCCLGSRFSPRSA